MQWYFLAEFPDTRAPTSNFFRQVLELYQQAAMVQSMHAVYYATYLMWKPMSDILCWLCQKNSVTITRSANRPEEESK